MSFLKKSDLKKHLSAKEGSSHHNESQPKDAARVILRDGNLITLPAPPEKENASPLIEQADRN